MFATKGYWVWLIIVIIIVTFSNAMRDTNTDDYNDNNVSDSIITEQGDQLYDFNGQNITINVPENFAITEENEMYFIENEDSYAVVYIYDKSNKSFKIFLILIVKRKLLWTQLYMFLTLVLLQNMQNF